MICFRLYSHVIMYCYAFTHPIGGRVGIMFYGFPSVCVCVHI